MILPFIAVPAGRFVCQRVGSDGESGGQQVAVRIRLVHGVVRTQYLSLAISSVKASRRSNSRLCRGHWRWSRGRGRDAVPDAWLLFDVYSQGSFFTFVQHFVNIFEQGRIALAHTALHVGRSEMGDQYGMCPAFGNDTLAYVSGGIEIEVGRLPISTSDQSACDCATFFPGVYSKLPWVPK